MCLAEYENNLKSELTSNFSVYRKHHYTNLVQLPSHAKPSSWKRLEQSSIDKRYIDCMHELKRQKWSYWNLWIYDFKTNDYIRRELRIAGILDK